MTTQRFSKESSACRSLQLSLGRTAYLFFIPSVSLSLQIGADGPRRFNPRLPQPGWSQFRQPIIHPALILNSPVSKIPTSKWLLICVSLCVCVCVCLASAGRRANLQCASCAGKNNSKTPPVCVTRRDDIHTSLEPLHFTTLLRADTLTGHGKAHLIIVVL